MKLFSFFVNNAFYETFKKDRKMKPNLGIIQGELSYAIFYQSIKQIKHRHISEGNEEVWEYVRNEVYMGVKRRTILHSTFRTELLDRINGLLYSSLMRNIQNKFLHHERLT